MQEHDREITAAKSPEFAKWLNNATSEALDAALKAQAEKILEDYFDCSDFVPCRTLRFIHGILNEPCREESGILARVIQRMAKEQAIELLEALFLDLLVSQGEAEIARNWYWLKPAIVAFCKSLAKDIRNYLRTTY